MMSDLIDRQNAIDVLEILADKMSDEGQTVMAQAVAVLKDLRSAEPERKKGEWIDTDNYYQRWKCSECGCHTRDAEPNYCPHCGADIRGKHE